jgi:diguanylate cyclase (GGDEF)-like protein
MSLRGSSILAVRSLFSSPMTNDVVDRQVRKTLVHSLYSNPSTLFIGALCGTLVCIAAALAANDFAMEVVAVGVGLIALLRSAMMMAVKYTRHATTRTLELLFEVGAFAYAGALSALAVLAVTHQVMIDAQMVLVVVAASYATAIAARNAGRPAIALGQLLLVLVPLSLVLLFDNGPLMRILGFAMLLHIASVVSITLNVYRTLRTSIASADTSARLADQMREQARTDVVTGLLNRAGMNHELVEQLMRLPKGQKLALFWLDLDRFKEVNDTLGHAVGDGILADVARRLTDVAPAEATIARFGGDEFIAACPVDDRGECEQLASAFIGDLSRPFRIDGNRIGCGASMGVALLPDDGPDIETVMQSADLALYHANVGGRNQLRFFDPAMTRDLVRKKEIETELRAAIRKDELSIFFQPIVDLKTGRIRTFEALVRWFHPEKGELRPDEFIPVAEETGVIITLGNWITAQAAKAAAQWPDEVTIAVNLSPLQIRAPGAALGILNAIRDAGLPPHRLELEVTESLFIEDSEHTARFMEELAAEGVRFALDDFGTGYSSLGYINQFPFKKIKVDRSFVSGPNIGKKSDAIIRAVAEMGSTLEMEIVAEGLETIEQVEAVRSAGCTLGQGYYFSRAVPDFLAAMLLAQERDGRDTSTRLAG